MNYQKCIILLINSNSSKIEMDKYNELLQQFQQANQNIEKLNQTLTEKESEIKVVYKFLI